MIRLRHLIIFPLLVLSTIGTIYAADKPPKDHLGTFPVEEYATEILLKEQLPGGIARMRKIPIHRVDPTVGNPTVYFHRPVWQLLESQTALVGYPKVVFSADPLSDNEGKIVLEFAALLSSPEIREKSTFAVTSSKIEAEYINRNNGTLDNVEVRRWPITHAIVECVVRNSGKILSTHETNALNNLTDVLDFYLSFSPDLFETFKYEASRGNIDFIFTYSYTGRKTFEGTVSVTGLKKVILEAKNILTSAQLDEKQPILQEDKNSVSRAIELKVASISRIQHKDLRMF